MVGHGSSDNAASYGVYAFGLLPHWTALRDSISLTVYYGAELDMSGCTALALSQSGRTPDVVEYARAGEDAAAPTPSRSRTTPASELAREADAVLELRAGPRAGGRGDEDVLEPARRARPARRPRRRRGRAFADGAPRGRRDDAAAHPSVESRIANVAMPFA